MRLPQKNRLASLFWLILSLAIVFRAGFVLDLLPGRSTRVIDSVSRIRFNETGTYFDEVTFLAQGDHLYVGENQLLRKYRNDGELLWEKEVETDDLALVAEDKDLYLIDKAQGHIVRIDENGQILASHYGLGNLSFVSIEKDSVVLLRPGEVIVLEGDLTEKRVHPIQNGEVLHVKRFGDRLYFSQLIFSEGTIGHDLYEYALNGLILEGHKFSGEIILDFDKRDGELWVVTDQQCYRVSGEATTGYPFQHRIQSVLFDADRLILSFSKEADPALDVNANEGVLILSRELELLGETYLPHAVDDLVTIRGGFAIAGGDRLYFYDETFNLLQERAFDDPVETLVKIDDRHLAAVTLKTINLITLR
jgi:hypothetical protein